MRGTYYPEDRAVKLLAHNSRDGRAVIRYLLAGAAIAVAATFPLAAIVALVFRFPIPFGSYMSGPGPSCRR